MDIIEVSHLRRIYKTTIGVFLVLAGFIMFRLFETKAKQLGTLDIF